MKTVDVIIPTYKPDKKLLRLLDMLSRQTLPVEKVIIVNTEEKYFDRLVYGTNFAKKYKNVFVYHHSKREFDHGYTRNRAVSHSDADVFVMMTQDAVPQDEFLTEKLVEALYRDEDVLIAYARQLANEDCREMEKYTRTFNYPDKSFVKSIDDLGEMGIKTYFCSNVCAAYKREEFLKLGGFVKRTIFNEDMIFAAKAMKAGGKVAYVAEAKVIHSHNYTAVQQFKRNFDLGVSQAEHPEVFEGIPSESEGMKLVKKTTAHLKKNHLRSQIFTLYVHSACKLFGYKLGKNYKKLPKKLILKCTMSREYWQQHQMKREVSGIDASKGYGKNIEKEG